MHIGSFHNYRTENFWMHRRWEHNITMFQQLIEWIKSKAKVVEKRYGTYLREFHRTTKHQSPADVSLRTTVELLFIVSFKCNFNWQLFFRNVSIGDSGKYACTIPSSPLKMDDLVFLTVKSESDWAHYYLLAFCKLISCVFF